MILHYRIRLICWLTCIALCLTGCAWRTRSVNQLPPALHRIHIKYPDTIDVSLLKTWEAKLTAMGVQITSDPTVTIFHLKSSQITYTASAQVNSNLPVSYTFTGTLTYTIEKPNTDIIFGPSTLASSVSVSMPEQSLYDSSQNQLTRQRINQALLSLLYAQLTSPDVYHALEEKKTQQHRRTRHRKQHTSRSK